MKYVFPEDEQGWILELDSSATPWLERDNDKADIDDNGSATAPQETTPVFDARVPAWTARVYLRAGRPPGGLPHPHRTEAPHVA
jgi:hypothetical protein